MRRWRGTVEFGFDRSAEAQSRHCRRAFGPRSVQLLRKAGPENGDYLQILAWRPLRTAVQRPRALCLAAATRHCSGAEPAARSAAVPAWPQAWPCLLMPCRPATNGIHRLHTSRGRASCCQSWRRRQCARDSAPVAASASDEPVVQRFPGKSGSRHISSPTDPARAPVIKREALTVCRLVLDGDCCKLLFFLGGSVCWQQRMPELPARRVVCSVVLRSKLLV